MAGEETHPRTLVLGCDANCVPNLQPLLTEVIGDGFDFLSVPLVHPRHRRDSAAVGVSKTRAHAFTRSDMLLPSSSWTRSVVGKVSPWLWPALEATGPGGEFSPARRNAEDALKQELAWASHLSLPAVLFPQLPFGDCSNTCRLINQCVQQQPYFQVWITVPLTAGWSQPINKPGEGTITSGSFATADAKGASSSSATPMAPPPRDPALPLQARSMSTPASRSSTASASASVSAWGRWNRLRLLSEHSQALFVALELGADLPCEEEVARFEGEPVKVLLVPVSAFLTNKKGFPVLSKRHQSVIRRFAKFNAQVLVTGTPRHAHGRKVYQQYLRHAHLTLGAMSGEEQVEAPYLDYLQAPLQPLMDNLESQTYETFERDPVKYEQYRKAVALALVDVVNTKTPHAFKVHQTETSQETSKAGIQDAPPPPESGPESGPEPEETQTAVAEVAVGTAMEDDVAITGDENEERSEDGSDYSGDSGDDEAGNGLLVSKDPLQRTKPASNNESLSGVELKTAECLEVVLMVVGAGRGPLVRASLKAGAEVAQRLKDAGVQRKKQFHHRLAEWKKETKQGSVSGSAPPPPPPPPSPPVRLKLRVFAVEKNPNAVVTLRALAASEVTWGNVTVVSGDMRSWEPPNGDLADIMVSELLGSFGDNELSPECLDGAQRFLKPGSGISIPVDYTSYLSPLASAKLWNEAKHNKAMAMTPLKALETAYVVKLHNVTPLAPPQLAFTFGHPNPDWPEHVDNTRYRSLEFVLKSGATVHGLAGYFESRLYGDVYISILPGSPNYSHGMFSWFPLYFPLRTPVYCDAGEALRAHVWRNASSSKVWYEWTLGTDHAAAPVHNPNGRSYWIGL